MLQRIDWSKVLRVFVALGLLAIIIVFLNRVWGVVTPFVVAVAIAYILHPVVKFFERRGLSRIVGIAVTYILLGLVVAVFSLFIIPVLVEEVNRLVDNVPHYVNEITMFVAEAERFYAGPTIPPVLREAIDQALEKYQIRLEEGLDIDASMGAVMTGIGGFFGGMFQLILGPILAVYFLKDARYFRERFRMMIPADYREAVTGFVQDANWVVSGFVHGRLIVSAIVGIIASVALALFGIRFYLVLGLFAGLTNLIPYFGPFVGAVPALIVAGMDSWAMMIRVAILYVLIQQLDGLVLTPRILSHRMGLHPLAVIFAVLAGGALMGFWGLFLGVPIAGILRVCLDHLLRWILAEDPA